MGRPATCPPAGMLTIKQAAARAAVTYRVAYRYAKAGLVRIERAANGVLLIDERDVSKIARHQSKIDPARVHLQLLPSAARHQAWARAARAAGFPTVTSWLSSMADAAAVAVVARSSGDESRLVG